MQESGSNKAPQGLLRPCYFAWGGPFPGRSRGIYNVVFVHLNDEGRDSMSMPSDPESIQPVTRQGQIIIGGLISGVVFFLVIATVVDLGPNPGVVAENARCRTARSGSSDSDLSRTRVWSSPSPHVLHRAGSRGQQQRRTIAAGNVTAGTNLYRQLDGCVRFGPH